MATVKAWIYTNAGYPETLQFQDIDAPPKPATNHILVQVKAAALNPVDVQMMNLPINSIPGLNGPKIVGRDFAGIVLDAAPGIGFVKGDEVMGLTMAIDGSGSLTEVAHIDIRSSAIVKKPENMSWNEAASLPLVWLTAYTAIERCAPYMQGINGQNKIVVLGGSSATGIYSVQLARKRGWKVLSTCSGRNAEFVRHLGANEVVDYTVSPDAVYSAVYAFKPDAVVDCVGGTDCIGLAKRYVTIVGDKILRSSVGGKFLYLISPRMVLRWLLGYIGLGNSYDCILFEMNNQWLQEATKLPSEDIVIDSVFQFGTANEAFKKLSTGRARGKVVIEIQS
ncbi:chaperonin 10-like protein [Truncatella angustata]|uniref:Chaperonin 10-like protein n=1 Tax=Truncatella angustata TaxID=152316 RepID=A0A9P8ZSY5_9PEZI|nr:chaperonin 10-like protein [Truncatella angustata]KAH6648276.1 chaperonin 10-like protein [Truncatella angustata]